MAAYQGRFSDAVRILEEGAAADLEADYAERAAAKFAALAHAHLSQDNPRDAAEAAEQALVHGTAVSIRFLAARTFVEAGDTARARREVGPLASELELEPQAYAKIVEGAIALKEGDPREAVGLLQEANELFDTWIGHFELGLAYLELGADLQTDSEFDDCLGRRGEALSLVSGRGTHLQLFPVGLLLPGSRSRESRDRGIRRLLRPVSRYSRRLRGRCARCRGARPNRQLTNLSNLLTVRRRICLPCVE